MNVARGSRPWLAPSIVESARWAWRVHSLQRKICISDAHRERGECVACGYDRTGNVSGACPECGSRISSGALVDAQNSLRLAPD